MQFPIFPCGSNKVPLIKDWKNQASTDPLRIQEWQHQFGANLRWWGIPCGKRTGILVLDVDAKSGGLETLKSVSLPPTLSQRTQSGGIHFIYRYPQDGRHYGNRAGFQPGFDIRGEGGYILFYGTDTTPINDAPAWLLDAIATRPEPEIKGTPVAVAPNIAMGIIEKCLTNIREAQPGERNNVLNAESFKVFQLVASGSVERSWAENALTQAALSIGLSPKEISATIESSYKGGVSKPKTSPFDSSPPPPPPIALELPPPRWTPQVLTQSELFDISKLKRPQIFQDWCTEDFHITVADGGTGKTTLKLFQAVCMAVGLPFLGFPCLQTGRTLYITGEDTREKLAARVGLMCRSMKLTPDQIETVRNSVFIKKDSNLTLVMKDRQGFLHPNAVSFQMIMEAVEDIRPKYIVFDPIDMFWGNERDLNDMARAVSKFISQLVDNSGACVEIINHMSKASSSSGDTSQFAGRGGTGLPSHSRVSVSLHEIDAKKFEELTGRMPDEGTSHMQCTVNKFTDGSPLYKKPFIIERNGFCFSRITMTDQAMKQAEREQTAIERVFAFIKQEREKNKYPTVKVIIAWFQTCSEPLPKSEVERAITILQYHGHMGERIKQIENPDMTIRDKAFVIIDNEGRER